MYKYINLPDIIEGKIIPKNFGHIGHLTGSKMIDNTDILLSENEQSKYTVCKRDKNDKVIILEKIDGMNAGVVKNNGYLYPVNRKGYDTRNMGKVYEELELLGNEWAKWVDDHYATYDAILNEGERLVFENCILQHTIPYKFRREPVFLLAKFTANNKKINFNKLIKLSEDNDLQLPPVLNIGVAIPPEIILKQYPKGIINMRGITEGIVYNYEHNGEHESCAKFVSNPIMGTVNTNLKYYNKFYQRMK